MKRGTKQVASLVRGLTVLRAVHAAPGTSLHELHRQTSLPKATLLRSLRTLEASGFLTRRLADGGYLPAAFATPAAGSPKWLPLTEAAGPSLEALSHRIPWPTDLGVRDGTAMLVLESNRRLSSIGVNRTPLGARPHMLWSAMGRAYLAFCPEAERDEILTALRASKAPEDALARQQKKVEALLSETRARAYGVRDSRYNVLDAGARRRVAAIAVPVMQAGAVIACVNCVWLADVMEEKDVVARHLGHLRAAAAAIAKHLRGDGIAASFHGVKSRS
ncbi:MAG TPA: helix-turn-helix domain-containing protein [Burkholderiales bacterium]|nr:helix-turn-helix domain-containing protein [Burkholderiales bacterium]